MNKKLPLVLSTTLLLAMSNTALAVDSKVSGFADIIWTLSDGASDVTGGKNTTEGKFTVDGEVDFAAKLSDKISVRVDLDLSMGLTGGGNASTVTGGPADSAVIEQAFFAWSLPNNLTFLGGVFNNPVGWEGQDAPDLYQTTHNQNWNILDGQTALHANNVAGVALATAIGPVTLTGALLNDLQQVAEENSIALVANFEAMPGLDFEFGYVTQDNNVPGNIVIPGVTPGGAGNVTDINGTWVINDMTFAVELLLAEALVDDSIMLLGNFALPMGFGVTVRYEAVTYENVTGLPDLDVITVAGTFHAADNLDVLLEWRALDDGTVGGDNDLITAEFVAKF